MKDITIPQKAVLQLIDALIDEGVKNEDVYDFFALMLDYRLTDEEIAEAIEDYRDEGYCQQEIDDAFMNLHNFREKHINQYFN